MYNNKIIFNIEKSIPKKISNISTGNLYGSDYSTITNSNIYSNKNIVGVPTGTSPAKSLYFNTIDDYSSIASNLSRVNIEHDILLSSLKKKLAMIKEERKKSEICVTNKRKKIYELQKEEQKSLKQLENTKKYIKKIIDNRKKHNNQKNFDIKITKINNIFQTNKNPRHKILNMNDISNLSNTWLVPRKKKVLIKKTNLSHNTCSSELEKIKINYNLNKNNRLTIDLNEINYNKNINYNNSSNYNNTKNRTIYNRKKISKNNSIKNNNKISNNKKTLKENLIQRLRQDEEEKTKIQKQIEEIEKEQNILYNNFYENFAFNFSSKTLDLNDNDFHHCKP
jgi:hypothetical protein